MANGLHGRNTVSEGCGRTNMLSSWWQSKSTRKDRARDKTQHPRWCLHDPPRQTQKCASLIPSMAPNPIKVTIKLNCHSSVQNQLMQHFQKALRSHFLLASHVVLYQALTQMGANILDVSPLFTNQKAPVDPGTILPHPAV